MSIEHISRLDPRQLSGGTIPQPTTGKTLSIQGDLDVTGTIDPERILFSVSGPSPTYDASAEGEFGIEWQNGLDLNFKSDTTDNILHLNNNGNVGLGTSEPAELLELKSNDSPVMTFHDAGTASFKVGIDSNDGANGIFKIAGMDGGFGGHNGDFNANDTQVISMRESGRVGIGNVEPNHNLHVTGGITADLSSGTAISLDDQTAPDGLGIKRITVNDGSGNLIIRGGTYFTGGLQTTVANNNAHAVVNITSEGASTGGAINLQTGELKATAGETYANNELRGFNVVHDNGLSYYADGVFNLFRVLPNGNVGIGVSTPTEKLQVAGNIEAISGTLKATGNSVNTGQGASILWNSSIVEGGVSSGRTTFLNHRGLGGGGFTWSQTNDNILYTELARLNPNGSFGLGTSNPQAKLHVDGTILVGGEDSTGANIIMRAPSTNTSDTGDIIFQDYDGTEKSRIYTGSDDRLYFSTSSNANPEVTITDVGDVGIGTTTPTEKLDVDGGARIRQLPDSTDPTHTQIVADSTGVLHKRGAGIARVDVSGSPISNNPATETSISFASETFNTLSSDITVNLGSGSFTVTDPGVYKVTAVYNMREAGSERSSRGSLIKIGGVIQSSKNGEDYIRNANAPNGSNEHQNSSITHTDVFEVTGTNSVFSFALVGQSGQISDSSPLQGGWVILEKIY